jgi:putative ABC transport system permease protein
MAPHRISRLITRICQFGYDAYGDTALVIRRLRTDFSGPLIVLLLALAAASNVTLYTLVFAVTIRPLPYGDPDQLVLLWNKHKQSSTQERGIVTRRDVSTWQDEAKSFVGLATAELWTDNRTAAVDLISGDSTSRLTGGFVSSNFFDVLRVQAKLGRTFTEHDSETPVAVISHRLWQERFGASSHIVGQSILLAAGRNRAPRSFTIIGVLSDGFQFTYPEGTQIWLMQSGKVPEDALLYWVVGRLRPSVSHTEAQAEMVDIAAKIAREKPSESFRADRTIYVEPISHYVMGDFQPLLLLMWVAVIASALIAMANIGCILAASNAQRRNELDTRYALGATPWRLIRQLAVETSVLTFVGALLGCLVAVWTQDIVRSLLPPQLPRARELAVTGSATGITVLTAGCVGLLTGLLLGAGLPQRYRHAFRTGIRLSRGHRVGLATGLVVTQSLLVTVALTLATGALVHLYRLERTEVGFSPSGLVVSKMELLAQKYRQPHIEAQFYDLVAQHLRSRHDVQGVAIASNVPFSGISAITPISMPGGPSVAASRYRVDPNYFDLFGVQFIAGRTFAPDEIREDSRVVILSRTLARAVHGTVDVVGRSFWIGSSGPLEIVGVVSDVRDRRLDEPPLPTYYVPRAVGQNRTAFVVVRVKEEGAHWGESVQSAIHAIDPAQPIGPVLTSGQLIRRTVQDRAFASTAIAIVAGLAWILALSGFIGLVTWDLRERRVDTGVRIAVGASTSDIVRDVIFRTLYPVGCGVLLALPIAFLVTNIDVGIREMRLVVSMGPGFLLASSFMLATSAAVALFVAVSAARAEPARILMARDK